jgi:chromosome segregation ATPase
MMRRYIWKSLCLLAVPLCVWASSSSLVEDPLFQPVTGQVLFDKWKDQYESQIEQLRQNLEKNERLYKQSLQEKDKEIGGLKEDRKKITLDRDQVVENLNALSLKLQEHEKKLMQHQKLEKDKKALKDEKYDLVTQQENLKSNIQNLTTQLLETKKRLGQQAEELKKYQHFSLKEETFFTQHSGNKAKNITLKVPNLEELKEENRALSAHKESLKKTIDVLERKKSELEESIEQLSSNMQALLVASRTLEPHNSYEPLESLTPGNSLRLSSQESPRKSSISRSRSVSRGTSYENLGAVLHQAELEEMKKALLTTQHALNARELELKLLQNQMASLEPEKGTVPTEEMVALKKTLAEKEEALTTQSQFVKTLEAEKAQLMQTLARLPGLQEKYNALEGFNAQLVTEKAALRTELSEKESLNKTLAAKLEAEIKSGEQKTRDITKHEKDLLNVTQNMEDLQQLYLEEKGSFEKKLCDANELATLNQALVKKHEQKAQQLRKQQESLEKTNTSLQYNLTNLTTKVATLETALVDHEKVTQKAKEAEAQAQAQVVTLTQTLKVVDDQKKEREVELKTLQGQHAKVMGEKAVLEKDLAALAAVQVKQEKNLADLNATYLTQGKALVKSQTDADNLKKNLTDLNTAHVKQTEALVKLQKNVVVLNKERQDLIKEKADLVTTHQDLNRRLTAQTVQLNAFAAQQRNDQQQLATTSAALLTVQDHYRVSTEALQAAQVRHTTLTTHLQDVARDKAQLQAVLIQKQQEIHHLSLGQGGMASREVHVYDASATAKAQIARLEKRIIDLEQDKRQLTATVDRLQQALGVARQRPSVTVSSSLPLPRSLPMFQRQALPQTVPGLLDLLFKPQGSHRFFHLKKKGIPAGKTVGAAKGTTL